MSNSTSYICDIKIKYIFFNRFELLRGNEVKVEVSTLLNMTSKQFIHLWQTYVFTSVLSNIIMI